MFRFRKNKGKDAGVTGSGQAAPVSEDGREDQSEAQGFICPICKMAFQGPLELQTHFEVSHTDGGPSQQPSTDTSPPLISFEDRPTSPDGAEAEAIRRPASESTSSEVLLLQQELADLAAKLKEEIWYTSQLKIELDKVGGERDKLEEEKAMIEEEYSSKLRSAEDGFLQVAMENDKLKEELKFADYKTHKERDVKLKKEIDDLSDSLRHEAEKIKCLEEQKSQMMSELNIKNEFLDALKKELEARPSDSYIKELENEKKTLKENIDILEKEKNQELHTDTQKWTAKFDEMNQNITSLQLRSKELEIERDAKAEQIESLQTTLKASMDSHQQLQGHVQEKQGEIIRLQHLADEAQASLKEKANFVIYLEKQIDELKNDINKEGLEKQGLQQELRVKDKSIDDERRIVSEKEIKIRELQALVDKKKEDMERMETERTELLSQIEAGEGVHTAINQLKQEKEKLIDGVAILEKEMEEQIKKFNAEVNTLREEKLKAIDDLQNARDKVTSLEGRMSKLAEELQMTQVAADDLKREVKTKGDQLKQMESDGAVKVGKLEVELNQKKEVLTAKDTELTGLRQQYESSLMEGASLRANEAKSEANCRQKEQEIEVHRGTIEKLMSDLSNKETELRDLTVSINQKETMLKDKIEMLQKTNDKLDLELKSRLREIEGVQDRVTSKEKEISQLKEELGKNESAYASCQQDLNTKQDELSQAVKQIKVLEEKALKEAQEMKSMQEEHSNQLREKEEECNLKEKENEKLHQAQLQQLTEKIETLKEDAKHKEESNTLHTTKLKETFENELSEMNLKVNHLEEYLKESKILNETEKNQRLSVESKLATLVEEKTALETSLEQKDVTLEELQRNLEVAQQELKKQCESCLNYERQLCRLEETFSENSTVIADLEAEKINLSNQIKTLKDTHAKMDDRLLELQAKADQNELDLKKTISELNEVNKLSEARLVEIDHELKEAHNTMNTLRTEQDSLSTTLQSTQENLNQVTFERDQAIKDLDLLHVEIKEREEDWSKENKEVQEKCTLLIQEKSALQTNVQDVQDLLDKEKKMHEDTKATAAKMQNVLKEEITSLQTKNENLRREKDDATKSIENTEKRLTLQLTAMTENITAAKEELTSRDRQLENLRQEMKTYENEKDDLRGDIAVLEAQIQHLGDEKKALSERIILSEDQLKKKQEKLSEYKQRLDQAISALHELGQENQNLQIKHNIQLTRQWEDDQLVTNCKACNKAFSLTIRKHHCRHCGLIFCAECSSYNIQAASAKKPVRCCAHCFSELSRLQGRRSSQVSMS